MMIINSLELRRLSSTIFVKRWSKVRKRMLRNIFDVMVNVIKWNKCLSLLSKRIYNVDEIIEYDFIVDDDY